MHIADEILREVEENKIADIFSEPEKTKVLLQLKELHLIVISESGVLLSEEGRRARKNGIKAYFREKKEERAQMEVYVKEEVEEPEEVDNKFLVVVPMFVFLILILGLAWMFFSK